MRAHFATAVAVFAAFAWLTTTGGGIATADANRAAAALARAESIVTRIAPDSWLGTGLVTVGSACPIVRGGKDAAGGPVAWRVPLFYRDGSARFLTLREPDLVLIDVPSRADGNARYILSEREWRERAGSPIEAPPGFEIPLHAGSLPLSPESGVETPHGTEILGEAIDLAQTTEGLFLLPGLSKLPTRDQDEALVPLENLRAAGIVARYDPSPRVAPRRSLAFAAADLFDWFRIALATEADLVLDAYPDPLSGRTTAGVNPAVFEAQYLARAARDPVRYTLGTTAEDLVTGRAFPASLTGMAEILTAPDPLPVPDPYGRDRPVLGAPRFPFDELYIELFSRFAGRDEVLATALRDHGPALAALSPRVLGLPAPGRDHAVLVVGRHTRGGRTRFIYRDDLVRGPAWAPLETLPVYRSLPVEAFRTAVVFPHRMHAELRHLPGKNRVRLTVTDDHGTPLEPDVLDARYPDEGSAVLLVREGPGKYYFPIRAARRGSDPGATSERAVFSVTLSRRFFTLDPEEAEGLELVIR